MPDHKANISYAKPDMSVVSSEGEQFEECPSMRFQPPTGMTTPRPATNNNLGAGSTFESMFYCPASPTNDRDFVNYESYSRSQEKCSKTLQGVRQISTRSRGETLIER